MACYSRGQIALNYLDPKGEDFAGLWIDALARFWASDPGPEDQRLPWGAVHFKQQELFHRCRRKGGAVDAPLARPV